MPSQVKCSWRKALLVPVLVAGTTALAACSAQNSGDDDAYPNDTIEIIVPFSAGGPTDTVTRIVADSMSKDLGEQLIVKNVEGAGGTIGAGEAAAASPDGYTALLHHIGMSTAPALYDNLNFDPVKDFKTVGLVAEVPMTIISRKDLGPANLEELIAYIKENADSIKLANAGVGSASNLCGLLLEDELGVDLKEVPYDGAAPAMTDLLAGQVDILCDQTTNTTSQIKAGKVDAYAVTTPTAIESLPDLPTADEAGIPGFELSIWHGFYLPAETPDEVVDALQASLEKALADPAVIEQLAELGTTPSSPEEATPDGLTKRLTEQIDLWAGVLEGQKG